MLVTTNIAPSKKTFWHWLAHLLHLNAKQTRYEFPEDGSMDTVDVVTACRTCGDELERVTRSGGTR